ncbi:MAG: DUF4330 domain-containing protein [Oscillatoriales cyanobacterium SM2_2_1]|nr:DUF4330 domain-containing protein [Oscillatoriales cyanobacterium SM2_2_1]
MALLDRHGRLWGKVSLLDLGVVVVVLIALAGLLLVPGNNGYSIAQLVTAETKPVTVEMIARGLSAMAPEGLIKAGDRVSLVIRNQPRGQIVLKGVRFSTPKVLVAKPDGTIANLPDPRAQETSQTDVILTLEANAQVTSDGVVFGNEKIKVGTSLDIEAPNYIVRGSAMAVTY